MALNLSLHSVRPPTHTSPLQQLTGQVNALIIMASDGTRILSKYYHPPHTPKSTTATAQNPYPTLKEQKAFEKGLLDKTVKTTADIVLFDNHVVVFKAESDVMLYVVGGMDENEMMLYQVVLALRDTLQILLKCVPPGEKTKTEKGQGADGRVAETQPTSAPSSRTTT